MSDFKLCYTPAQAEEIAAFEKLAADNYNELATEKRDVELRLQKAEQAIEDALLLEASSVYPAHTGNAMASILTKFKTDISEVEK